MPRAALANDALCCSTTRGVAVILTGCLFAAGDWSSLRAAEPVDAAPPTATVEQTTAEVGHVWFDGQSLEGWKVADQFDFEDHGPVAVQDGVLRLGQGDPATGIVRTAAPPTMDYEVQLEARRVEGRDFFCGLTFPIRESFATLIVGGWGGGVIGISNIDGASAAENSTSRYREFEQNRWYRIRLRVTGEAISMWLDDERVIHQLVGEHRFKVWWEMEPMRPLGIATWHTAAELRGIRLIHPLPAEQVPEPAAATGPSAGATRD